MSSSSSSAVRCHYEILGVAQDADTATIKKHHRKMALKYHPDKNLGDETAAEQFRLVQQAYECLSDPQERKWYDDHRDAILAGWSSGGNAGGEDGDMDMVFNVVPYMHPGCYSGYDDDIQKNKNSFYAVYTRVFEEIVQYERRQSETLVELPTDFGTGTTPWENVQSFYRIWECFVSALNFAWHDKYNSREDAPDRRIRRLMDDENKKARRVAKKVYNQDILTLVAFVKRRDPRVKAKQQELYLQKLEQEKLQKQQAAKKKQQQKKAKEEWMEEAQQAMEEAEEADRLAGRVRLADLEDDYDYGGGKKKKRGKGKKGRRRAQDDDDDHDDGNGPQQLQQQQQQQTDVGQNGEDKTDDTDPAGDEAIFQDEEKDENDNGNAHTDVAEEPPVAADEPIDTNEQEYFESEEEESEEEPDVWRCECCRKDFKSEGQMENHMKSKKHKEAFKKYQAKMKKKEEELLSELMDEVAMGP